MANQARIWFSKKRNFSRAQIKHGGGVRGDSVASYQCFTEARRARKGEHVQFISNKKFRLISNNNFYNLFIQQNKTSDKKI